MKLMTAVMLTDTDETSVLSAGSQPFPEGFSRSINLATMKVTCRDATDSSAQAYAASGDDGIISHKKKGSPKARNPGVLPKVSNNFSKAGTTLCGEARPQKKTPFVPSAAHHVSVKAIEVKKGEMGTQRKLDEEVLQDERRTVQTTKLTMDADQDEAVAQNLPKVSNNFSKAGTIQCGEARPAEVDDVSTRMNEEVANLKSVLKSVHGKMGEKEREVQRAMEGRGDTEKSMEEIRYVMIRRPPRQCSPQNEAIPTALFLNFFISPSF
jgi:hypothetical protein